VQNRWARPSVALVALLLAVVMLPMAAGKAEALASDLFFSEYIEGSSNNKALEIYNGTSAAVDLAVGGYNVFMSFNGGTSTYTINLTGTVASGDVFVVAPTNANATILAQADQKQGTAWFNGDDAVMLRRGTTNVDVIGQIGFDPGTEWGTGVTSTADNTLRRKSAICAGDANGADAFNPSAQWDGFATDTFGGLGAHSPTCTLMPPVINEFVADHVGVDTAEYIEVFGDPSANYSAFSLLQIDGDGTDAGVIDAVWAVGTTNASGYWFTGYAGAVIEDGTLTLLLVGDFTGAVGNDLDTNDDGTLDTAPWTSVRDAVAVNDGGASDRTYGAPVLGPNYDGMGATAPGGASRLPNGTDTDAAADWMRNDYDLAGIPGYTGTPLWGEAYNTPNAVNQAAEACGDPYTPIYQVQGNGLASPLVGTEVAVEGIVVGDFQTGGKNGYYLQDPTGDANPATSDGTFIYAPSGKSVNPGDRVRVRGNVSEYFNLTEITVGTDWICSTGNPLPAATPLALPVPSQAFFEPFEGMLVTFPQTLYIAEYFDFDRYGEIVLTGARQYTPTAVVEPGAPAIALAAANALDRITLDDGRTTENPDPARHPNGADFTLANRFRGGDTVTGVTGILDYAFSKYRIQPTQGATYAAANPRPGIPAVGGTLKVASFNVLNYFTTLGSRGANTAEEFTRQRAKIFAALAAINADVVGIIEIENNTAAIADLVAGLNGLMGAGTYAYINTGVIGVDEIKVALIYKPATVAPRGAHAVLTSAVDPRFDSSMNRPALAQTFQAVAEGGIFTVAVNHLKSKGSPCAGDPDLGDGAGNCNLTRRNAGLALVDWLASDPTGSGDEDFLIIGDLNSYDKEDPIDVLRSRGYTDLLARFQGEYAYSYAFDGQLGYLDYALEHFGDDDKGRQRAQRFLFWHLGFWHRWRPYTEDDFHAHLPESLIQRRDDAPPGGDDPEAALLASADEADHALIWRRLLDRDYPGA